LQVQHTCALTHMLCALRTFSSFNATASPTIYTLSLHALFRSHNIEFDKNIIGAEMIRLGLEPDELLQVEKLDTGVVSTNYCQLRSEEHTSELQSRENLVCRLLLEKKKNQRNIARVLGVVSAPP